MEPTTATAVIILGLPAASKAAKVAGNVAEDFLKRILGPVGDVTGRALAHPIAEWHNARVQRAKKLVEGAAALIDGAGLVATPVPGRILWPIIEKGSLEDQSDELQARWMSLLANAAAAGERAVHPAFVHILAELAPNDCRILDHAFGLTKPDEVWTAIQMERFAEALGLELRDIHLSVANLARLNLIASPVSARLAGPNSGIMFMTLTGPADYLGNSFLTTFGFRFVDVCRPPSARLATSPTPGVP